MEIRNNTGKKKLVRYKSGAAWVMLLECGEYIKLSAIARDCFGKSPSWFSQRLHSLSVNGKEACFKEEEYRKLTDFLRNIAANLIRNADTIDNATFGEDCKAITKS